MGAQRNEESNLPNEQHIHST